MSFYDSTAARSADAARPIEEDPPLSAGVLLDLRFSAETPTLKLAPGCSYSNGESPLQQRLWARVRTEVTGAHTATLGRAGPGAQRFGGRLMAATITDLSRRGDQGFALPGLFAEAHALLMAWITAANGQNPTQLLSVLTGPAECAGLLRLDDQGTARRRSAAASRWS